LDFFGGNLGVFERLPADIDRAFDQIAAELFQGLAGELALQMERFVLPAGDDEGEVYLRLVDGRKLALGFLGAVA
jgi:hypothetical protein